MTKTISIVMRRALLVAGLAVLLSLAACDGGAADEFPLEGDGIAINDIAGTWTATSALFSRAAAGPVLEVDIVALGGTATLVIQTNGRFTFTTMLPGEAPEVTTGQLGFDEDLLVVIYDDEPDDFEYFGIQFSTTTLSIQGPSTYDFDEDGTDEEAIVALDFVRG